MRKNKKETEGKKWEYGKERGGGRGYSKQEIKRGKRERKGGNKVDLKGGGEEKEENKKGV